MIRIAVNFIAKVASNLKRLQGPKQSARVIRLQLSSPECRAVSSSPSLVIGFPHEEAAGEVRDEN
jgi:hypothetical protein